MNRAAWGCLNGSRILLKLLIKVFGAGDEIVIGFDDHLERRGGKQIKAKGIYRDAVREKVTVVTKLRLDAALYEAAPERSVGQMGQPRKKGKRLPTLKEVSEPPNQVGKDVG